MDWKFQGQIHPMYDYGVMIDGEQTHILRDYSAVDAIRRAMWHYTPTHIFSRIESHQDKWASTNGYPKFDLYEGVEHKDVEIYVERLSEEKFWIPA